MSEVPANDPAAEDPTPEVDPEAPKTDPAKGPDDEPDPAEDDFDKEKALEKIRKANSEAKNLRQRAAEAEAKAKAAGENGEKVTALEAEVLKLRVALKHGLPENIAKRLQGTTEEELLEDAEELMGAFETRKPPTNQPREKLRGGGNPAQEPSLIDTDPDKFAERIFKD